MAHAPLSIPGVDFYGEWKAVKKARSLPRHKNPGIEIVLVSKGELRWEVENQEVELRANSVFYTLPWQEHGGVEEMQPSCEISYLCLKLARKYQGPVRRLRFHPAFAFTPGEARLISSTLLQSRTQAVPASEEIAWLVAHFFELVNEPTLLGEARARDTVKLILAHLAELIAAGRKTESRTEEAERRVRQFIQILAQRHAEPWTLDSMSQACRLGRTQFSQLLKKHTGDTPVTYLNRVRLRQAQHLLRHSDRSITDIALAVGFNSSQYFATVFKEFTTTDARSFRARHSPPAGK